MTLFQYAMTILNSNKSIFYEQKNNKLNIKSNDKKESILNKNEQKNIIKDKEQGYFMKFTWSWTL